jgi:hypothetical protein
MAQAQQTTALWSPPDLPFEGLASGKGNPFSFPVLLPVVQTTKLNHFSS